MNLKEHLIMISRDRIKAAFNFEETDKVPVDFGGHRSSGIAVQAYKRLREYLGLKPSKLFVYDVVQQLAVIEDDVLDIIGSDVVMLGYEFYKEADYWKEWQLHDGTEVKIPKNIDIIKNSEGDYIIKSPKGIPSCIQKRNSLYFEQTLFPCLDSNDDSFDNIEEQLNEIMWFHVQCPPDPNSFEVKGHYAKKLRSSTERAIYGIFGGGLMEPSQFSFRIDNLLLELAINPDKCNKFYDLLMDIHLRNLNEYLDYVGPYIDIIGFGDDLGMQTGAQISPAMFDTFFKHRYKKMWDLVKEKCPHLKICLHSCGSIYSLLPYLIEAGLDSFNPVQISCRNMEPVRLKKEFKDKILFWGGGCDTGSILSQATPYVIDKHVKDNIEIFSKNGGFIFQQVHNILADVPPQNIMAMFDAVKKYG